jgi:hypothetical protein
MKILNLFIASLLLSAMSFACSASDSNEQIKSLQNAQEPASKDSGKNAPSSSQGNPLPAMNFYSSLAKDTIYDAIKANPRFSKLDKELVGSPITLLVTHSVRPTAGGQAAGFLTGILSGSTLGLIPTVTNEQFVLRYEILLQGKPVSIYSFERTGTRAINMWSTDTSVEQMLGKDGMEWLKSTINEFIAKSANDPELLKIQSEINFYFNKK